MYEGLYEVGDRVCIIDEFHHSMDGGRGHSEMETFCGKEMTIQTKIRVRASTKSNDYAYYYEMVEDAGKWYWIEKIIKEKVSQKELELFSFTLPKI